jgi:succinyl-diaminopimelate desuccinylase
VTSSDYYDLDLTKDVAALACDLVDIPSESFHEEPIADAVQRALEKYDHLDVARHGNTIVARTNLGRGHRVVIGGHLDTVPANDNRGHRVIDDRVYGLGACDMKGGVAVSLALAAELTEPRFDVTYLYYDCEEVAAEFNGLAKLTATDPDALACDFAILMEPSNAGVEAGCQGTLRAEIKTSGARAHSARSWMGDNAIHKAGEIIDRLNRYGSREVTIDGLVYREGMNAVMIDAGVAGNVIPDDCTVTINYRYAPSRSAGEAQAHVRELFEGFEVAVVDNAPGARPGLDNSSVESFIDVVGAPPAPKFGWTDVSRFAAIGIPALNFGPGNPSLAHTKDEFVPIAEIHRCHAVLNDWLHTSE